MTPVEPELFSAAEMRTLVRRMIALNQKDGHDLTATFGGIALRWAVTIESDARTLDCELRGPGWVYYTKMRQEGVGLKFSKRAHVGGDRARFDTDIIYLKMEMS